MNSNLDKEIDSLLRHHSRRDTQGSPGSASFGEETTSEGIDHQTAARAAHLDADELNAYAENAVTGAARARYTAHLADCGRCRKIVTALMLDVGEATQPVPHVAPQTTSPGFWSGGRLADAFKSLFVPRTLGFALPVLLASLGVVMGVLFIAEHNRDSEPLIADRSGEAEIRPASFMNSNMNSSVSPTAQPPASAPTNQAEIASTSEAPEATGPTGSPVEQKASEANATKRSAVTPVTVPPTLNQTVPAPPAKLAAPSPAAGTNQTGARQSPQVNSEETAQIAELPINNRSAAQADLAPSVSDAEIAAAEAQKAKPARLEDSRESTGTPPAAAPRQDQDSVSPRPRAMSRAPAAAADRKAGPAVGVPVEVRRIGDRQFRRQPNGQRRQWVDAAYNSSITTINITRGSEPYRALIASEPELRRIIEQLDGEVIVVWKNRAYHVR